MRLIITMLWVMLLPCALFAQWEFREVIRPGLGSVECVRALSDKTILAIDGFDYVHVSRDAGWTWTLLDSLPRKYSGGLIHSFEALDEQSVLVIKGWFMYRVHADSGVVEELFNVGPESPYPCDSIFARPFHLSRSLNGELWLQLDGGQVLTSRDNGLTWTCELDTNLQKVTQGRRLYFVNDSLGFAIQWGGSQGLWRTTDRGSSWRTLDFNSEIWHVLPEDDGTVIAIGYQQWLSSDFGATWEHIPSPNLWTCSTAVRIDSLRAVAVGQMDVICTSDGGRTWSHGLDLQWEDRVRLSRITDPFHLDATPNGTVYLVHRNGVLISSTGCSDTIVTVSDRPPEESPPFCVVPNPATDQITLRVVHGPTTFVVTSSLSGQQMITVTVDEGEAPFIMNVHRWPAGHYLITRRDAHGIQTRAFVKL